MLISLVWSCWQYPPRCILTWPWHQMFVDSRDRGSFNSEGRWHSDNMTTKIWWRLGSSCIALEGRSMFVLKTYWDQFEFSWSWWKTTVELVLLTNCRWITHGCFFYISETYCTFLAKNHTHVISYATRLKTQNCRKLPSNCLSLHLKECLAAWWVEGRKRIMPTIANLPILHW